MTIPASGWILSFRHSYNFEADYSDGSMGYDGGVLELASGSGAFADILTAGGAFITGAYNRTLSAIYGNPLGGRKAWSGRSGGFITTMVRLPVSVTGQSVRFRWRCGTDVSVGGAGWYIDNVTLLVTNAVCCTPTADLALFQSASPGALLVGEILTYSLMVTNAGPSAAFSTVLTDTLPASAGFLSASPGCAYSNGAVTCNFGLFPAGAASNLIISVTAPVPGLLTNTATLATATPDLVSANDSATTITPVLQVPMLSGIEIGSGAVQVSLPSVSGLTYLLEYKTNLSDAAWLPILPSVSGTGGNLVLRDTNFVAGSRFYRVRCD